jgi:single-strand DNA-binding protein
MNKVILMGRLTKDPELRYTSGKNTAVCTFTLAVDRRAKPGEEKQADFFSIVAWERQAEFCSKWFQKGRMVAVVGRLQNRSWDDNEGKKHYITEVVAEGKKADGGAPVKPAGAAGGGQADGFYPLDEDDELPF